MVQFIRYLLYNNPEQPYLFHAVHSSESSLILKSLYCHLVHANTNPGEQGDKHKWRLFLSPLLKSLGPRSPRHPGGCQGLAAAATGWLSDEGQRQQCRGHGHSQRLHRDREGRRLSRAAAPLPRALRGCVRLLCCPCQPFCRGWHCPEKAVGRNFWGK